MATEEQNNNDLRATLAISREEAHAGTTRTLTLPGGRQVTVIVPPGVQSGETLRIQVQGLTAIEGKPAGDLLLSIVVASREDAAYSTTGEDANSSEETILTAPPPPDSILPSYGGSSPTRPAYSGPSGYSSYTPTQSTTPAYPNAQYSSPYAPPTPYMPGAQQQQRRSTGWTILLIVLALLVIGGGVLIYYSTVYLPRRASVAATATANTQAMGTAQTNATGTAQVVATTQSQANATATVISKFQASYDQSTKGTPALNDPLTDANSQYWLRAAGCTIKGDGYHIIETQKGYFTSCDAQSANYKNFAYQVQMKIVKGDSGGLIFRSDADVTKFYIFLVGQDGTYSFYYYPDTSGKTAKTLAQGTSDLVQTGVNKTNSITVIVQGSQFDLYINGKYLDSANDNGPGGGGVIGMVSNCLTNPTEVVYSQAKVWTL